MTIRVIRRNLENDKIIYWMFGDVWTHRIEEAQFFRREDTARFTARGIFAEYNYIVHVVEIELQFE